MDLQSGEKPEYVTYAELARKYGDLVYLKVFGKSILIVNSYELAHELFDKRGSIYSDRMVTPMLHDLTHFGYTALLTMPYSEKVTRQRAIIHDFISAKKVPKHWDMLEETARTFLCNLHLDPDNLYGHIRHALGASIIEMVYGIKTRIKNDPLVELAEETTACLGTALLPGSYVVDFLPILKYLPSRFPGLKFPKVAARLNNLYLNMMERPFGAVEELFESGQARPSLVTNYLEKLQIESSSAEDKTTMQQVATTLYLGGIDTTDVALQIFFLIIGIHPEVQEKAQEELDRVVGKDNLPSFRNQKDLPYISAICKEVLRWHTIGPFGMPHRLMQDDIVGEYFIPKGTLVFGNTRTLLRSTSKYGPDADQFRPERFLNEKMDFPDVAFGYGRRICPGRYFAEAGLFITIASSLHLFNISASDDKAVRDIIKNDLFKKGALAPPAVPYRCKFEIRPGLEETMQQVLNNESAK